MKPTKYQEGIFGFIQKGRGDGVVNAVAGSGKTTTLVMAADHLRTKNALFCAFNAHIKKELDERLRGKMDCKTIHSIGFAAIAFSLRGKRITVDEHKYSDLVDSRLESFTKELKREFPEDEIHVGYTAPALRKLVHLCQVTLVNPLDAKRLDNLADYHDVEIFCGHAPYFGRVIADIFEAGKRMAQGSGIIDFNDMIWIPHVLNLRPKKYLWIFVDECQDLSRAQLELVLKCRANGGRMLFVGDPMQSIYGFAGADPKSFWEIIRRTSATELPLSICFRCPTKVIEVAKQLVPQIEAREDAEEGVVSHITDNLLDDNLIEGDLILCRTTAPLIEKCISLIAKRVPARVKGRDIGKQIAKVVKDVSKIRGFKWEQFGEWLEFYRTRRVTKLSMKKHNENSIQALNDKVECVQVCYMNFDCNSADKLVREIENLFVDEQASIMLSTVHRAKGLENDRVFILKPELLPLRWKGQLEWQAQQELCCEYVAYTRAKKQMYYVDTTEG